MRYKINKWQASLTVILFFAFLLSGCTLTEEFFQPKNDVATTEVTATETVNGNSTVTATNSAAELTENPVVTRQPATIDAVTPSPEVTNLSIWIPPQFDPSQDTDEAKILTDLINTFMKENPGVSISFRIKGTSGDSNALNSLSAAKNAAPDVIPSLVILDRNDLLTAVQKGLVYPINTGIFSDTNSWYSFAKQASAADNLIYGIPIAGDALVMVYRMSKTGSEMTTWEDILSRGLPIAFVPSSSDALFPTFIYSAMGGKLIDDQGQPWLDQSILVQTLNFFLTGGQNGAFPPSLAQVVDQSQNWQMFLEGSVSIIISKFSTFRHNQGTDIDAISLPLFSDTGSYPLMNTWNIALTTGDTEIQKIGVKFAEKLADPIFNDLWTAQAGYFPVRESEHIAWENDSQLNTILKINPGASLIPNNQILNKISPILNEAVSKVIKSLTTPEQAAQEAIAELE
jgi:ABC-type glycerol-3-phosphate transport system substrate-binding protein